jgi:ferredoxin
MSFENQQKEMIQACEAVFATQRAELILGYTLGELEGQVIPAFVRPGEPVDHLVWNPDCTPNLAKYALGRKEKVAIVAKPCDARAIVMYLIEKQLQRDQVVLIGMECAGMRRPDGSLAPGCDMCTVKTPPLYDQLIQNPESRESGSRLQPQLDSAELLGNISRFQKELEKCLLCFSCRQVCYGCYCNTCFLDRGIPDWAPANLELGAKMVFHLGRAMHLAGRCVACGACERGCPSGVKIRYLLQDLNRFCQDLYGYQAGLSPDETPALAVFQPNDREEGFLGGDLK